VREDRLRTEQAETAILDELHRLAVDVRPEAEIVLLHQSAERFGLTIDPDFVLRRPHRIVRIPVSDPGQGRHEGDQLARALAMLPQHRVADGDDVVELHHLLDGFSVFPDGERLWPGRARRPEPKGRPDADLLEAVQRRLNVARIVIAGARAAIHREDGRRAELQSLEGMKLAFDVPPLRVRVVLEDGHVHAAPVGPAEMLAYRLDEPAAGVRVEIDHARHDDLAPGRDDPGRRVLSAHLGGRTDGDDGPSLDRHRSVVEHAASGVHGHDDSAFDQHVGQAGPPTQVRRLLRIRTSPGYAL
jgi:hypothetical protein